MARFTDYGFRALCKEQGADVLITEFVMADALVFGGEEAWARFDFDESQRPIGVQIFGSDPELMAKAAIMIEERIKPDFVDMNFGCPADRVTCQDAGSSLLNNLPKLKKVASSVVQAIPNTPVTAKIRIGWDDNSIIALDAGRMLEDAGVRCLTIHGRTKEQGYSGSPNWDVIASVHRELSIPVVGNGDIRGAEDILKIQELDLCSGIMIGRAALGYPWLFREIRHFMDTGKALEPPSLGERWRVILNYCRVSLGVPRDQEHESDIKGLRPKIAGLTKEMLGCKRLRPEIMKVRIFGELIALARSHMSRNNLELESIWQ